MSGQFVPWTASMGIKKVEIHRRLLRPREFRFFWTPLWRLCLSSEHSAQAKPQREMTLRCQLIQRGEDGRQWLQG